MSALSVVLPGVFWRYLFRSYLVTFFQVTVAIGMLIMLIDTVETARQAQNVAAFTLQVNLTISALKMPILMLTYIQFIALIASMMTLLRLNAKQELVIARASGHSVWQFLMPLCAGSVLLGSLAAFALSPLATAAQAKAESIAGAYGISAIRASGVVPWFRQQSEDGEVIIGARSSAEGGTQMFFVQFHFLGPNGGVARRIDAESAVLSGGLWTLSNAITYESGKPGVPSPTLTVPSSIDERYLQQAMTSSTTVPYYRLPESVRIAKAFGLPSGRFAMEFHKTLSLPGLLLSMTLIAATVSLKFARFGQSSSAILGGVLAGFLLYVVSEITRSFGTAEVVPPIFAAWLPVAAATMFGVTFLLYKEDG
jgi:lipopolysaccharide export system permease protein